MVNEREIINEQVTWLLDDVAMGATLTCPKEGGNGCGVVFVAGSGPTDRDWCSPLLPGSNGSGKLLAEVLAKEGFSTLRYDKRASGPHVQENMMKLIGKISMQSHQDEVASAVQALVASGKAPKGIFVLTSSEGEIHALNYQLQTSCTSFIGIVLTGAPGRAICTVVRTQIQAQLDPLPNGEALMKIFDAAVADFAADRPMTPDPALPEAVRNLLMALTIPANLPFAKEFWLYDPAKFLGKVEVPVLVVIGKKDVQVDWQLDGAPLEAATKGEPDVSFLYPENANHVLKFEPAPRSELTGMAAFKYNVEDTKLDPEAVEGIVGWLKAHLP
jgi:pimeloyl-ACP methyl ester carboxylesterase